MKAEVKRARSSYIIRFQDCDPYGHLNNARYLDYFLNAREDHLQKKYGIDIYAMAMNEKTGMVVTQNQISYIRPADLREEVEIESCLIDLDDTSVVVEMIMYDKALTHIKSILWVKVVAVDMKTGKRTTWPQTLKEGIESLYSDEVDIKNIRFEERVKHLLVAIKEGNLKHDVLA